MRKSYVYLLFAASLCGQMRRIDPPAGEGSGMPHLAQDAAGAVYLSWTEPVGPANDAAASSTAPAARTHALRFAKWSGSAWSAPETIAQGANWFVNWADFPALSVLPDGSMLAHWLARAESGGKFGYGIKIARRDPRTARWTQIHGMSLDEKEDYAGFLSFEPGGETAVFLSPPAAGGGHGPHEHGAGAEHRKTVRFVRFQGGRIAAEGELDSDACTCCPTSVGRTRNGLIAAYRDHSPGEIRDIAVVRYRDGLWSKPVALHADGWKINGCPTDGPSIAAADQRVAIAWLTRASGEAKVQVALSSDEGKTFGKPLRLDAGNPLGRPGIAQWDANGYVAVWLEKTTGAEAELRLRRIGAGGTLHPVLTLATVAASRTTGFPKLAVAGNQLFLAWRDQHVRAAVLTKQEIESQEKSSK